MASLKVTPAAEIEKEMLAEEKASLDVAEPELEKPEISNSESPKIETEEENQPIEASSNTLPQNQITLEYNSRNYKSDLQYYYLCETYFLDLLEKQYDQPIDREVKITAGETSLIADGYLEYEGKLTIIEIKCSRYGRLPGTGLSWDRLIQQITKVNNIGLARHTKPTLILAFIGNFKERQMLTLAEKIGYAVGYSQLKVDVKLRFETFESLEAKVKALPKE